MSGKHANGIADILEEALDRAPCPDCTRIFFRQRDVTDCAQGRLRLLFTGHDCRTAGYAKLSGLKTGALLTAAEAAGFEVLLTTDREIPYQQNLMMRQISVVILCAPTNRLADLTLLVPAALLALNELAPGQLVRID